MLPFNGNNSEVILESKEKVDSFFQQLNHLILAGDFESLDDILEQKSELLIWLEEKLEHQIDGIRSKEIGMRQSLLIFTIFLETKDLIAVAARFAKLYRRIQRASEGNKSLIVKPKRT